MIPTILAVQSRISPSLILFHPLCPCHRHGAERHRRPGRLMSEPKNCNSACMACVETQSCKALTMLKAHIHKELSIMRPWSLSGAQGFKPEACTPMPLQICSQKLQREPELCFSLRSSDSGFRVSGTQWHWAQKNPKRVPGCSGV